MRILQNPIVIKAGIALLLTCFFVLIGMVLIRRTKRQVAGPAEAPRVSAENAGFSLAAYEGVITRLKEQERELVTLRRSENQRARESATVSEAIISNLPSGVILFNTSGLVRQANPAARALLGYASPSSMHARGIFQKVSSVRFSEGISPGSATAADQLAGAIERSIRDGAQFRRVEADYLTPSGERRVLGITISSVRHTSGERLGAVCLLSDLSDIARLSQQVKLQENMAALGEMSAGIAHEFKNSLATISGYAQMLVAEPAPASGYGDFAARIADETSSLSRIVSDFLNFARPQGNAREPIDLAALVEECSREAHVLLRVRRSGQDFIVKGDPTALRQACSNLLRNAAEAAQQEASVVADLKAHVDSVEISLTDDAGGIAAEHLGKIFIPFFTTKPHGTGLGLALVHRIVTEHAGTISVESPVDLADGRKGTRFTLTFPRGTPSKDTVESSAGAG